MPATSMPMLPGQRVSRSVRIAPGQSAESVVMYAGTPENASVSACVPTSASVKITLPPRSRACISGMFWSSR